MPDHTFVLQKSVRKWLGGGGGGTGTTLLLSLIGAGDSLRHVSGTDVRRACPACRARRVGVVRPPVGFCMQTGEALAAQTSRCAATTRGCGAPPRLSERELRGAQRPT
jgi:hypothetical protein